MEKAREPTAALRFANAQRAASVGAPLAFSTNSFVHRAILWIDEAGTRVASVGAPPAFPAQLFRLLGYTASRWGWY